MQGSGSKKWFRVCGVIFAAGLACGALQTQAAQAAEAAQGASSLPRWLISSKALGLIDGYVGNNSLTVNAFDVASTIETGAVSSGWITQHARIFDAYGPATSTSSFLYAVTNHTVGSATYVLYDNESWSMTPSNEQQDPATYMADFVATAHLNGLKAILAPALDLTTKMTSCDNSSQPSWENYISNCNLPAMVASAAPDVYEIQAQSLQNNTSSSTGCGCYKWFVDQAVAQAEAVSPIGEVLAGLSTNPEGSSSSGTTMYTDTQATLGTVNGYWLNVPEQSNSCPTCQPGGVPNVAVDFLGQLGYSASGVQSISFGAPASGQVGGSATLSATGGSSGKPVVFSVDPATATGVCSVSGTNGVTVSYTGAGSCVIDANQAGNSLWQAAPQVTQVIAVGPGPQSIAFTAPSSGMVGGQASLSATGGPSGDPVIFSVDASSGAGVCSVSGSNGSTVSYSAAGTCVVDANQAGNANYAAAPQVTQVIAVGPGPQSIAFTAPSSGMVGGQASLSATGGPSGDPVIFSVDASSGAGVCSVSGSNGSTVSYSAAGTCVVDANQAGNANYAAAPQVTQTIAVGRGSQSIAFTAPSSGVVGGQASLSATGGPSGNPVVFSVDASSGSGVCSASGTNGSTVSYSAAGTCVVDANQAGSANYAAAPQVTQPIAVGPGSQSIAFTSTPPPTARYGGSYSVSATGGGSGSPIVFSSGTPPVCSISGSTVALVGVGTCTVLADQAGNASWTAALEASQSFQVGQAPQTIVFTSAPPANVVFGDPSYTVSATGGGSGNPVLFSSGSPSVCSISGSTVFFVGVGTCTVLADQAGSSDWSAATEASQLFTVVQATQTITFTSTAPTNASFGGPVYTVSANGGASGNPVTFSSATPSVCTVSGATVSFVGVGSCVVDADQSGNTDYAPALEVTQSFTVGKASQAIALTAPASGAVGTEATLSATGGASGNPVVFSVDSASGAGVCSLSGTNTATVSYAAVGRCVIDANQAGNANYSAALQVTQDITVVPGSQAITFAAPASGTVGKHATLAATGGASGNPVVFAVDPTSGAGVCSVSGTNGTTLSYAAVGNCVVDANEAGSANYSAAAQVSGTVTIGQGSQSITITSSAPANAVFSGPTYAVTAAGGGSNNPIVLSSGNPAVCSVSGASVSFVGVGSCTVLADQAGNANWAAAAETSQSFAVWQALQTISFTSTAPSNAYYNGPGYTLSANGGGSRNPVVFTSATPSVCSLTGSSVTFVGVGACTLLADQAGNADWVAAAEVSQSFTVGQASQVITFTSTPPSNAVFGGPGFTVSATGGASGNPVTFTSGSPSVCSVSGTNVAFVAAGKCVVNANQGGNANYAAASTVTQSVTVAQASQVITFTSTPPSNAVFGGPGFTVSATGGASGNPVTFTSGSPSVCSVSGTNVAFVGAGKCVVNANQAGNANYAAASTVTQSVTVAQATQSIIFTSKAPSGAVFHGPTYTVAATGGGSGNPVTFSSGSPTVCTVSGATVSFVGVGSCIVNANQAGNTNWAAASQISQIFSVSPAPQTITFTSTPPRTARVHGVPYTVTAAGGGSGNPVVFSSATTSVCTVSGSTVSFVHEGTCTIDANQLGNADWIAAPQVAQTFTVSRRGGHGN